MAQKLTPTEMVIKELGRFLVDGKPEVICVKGRWGVGKTYAWKRALQEAAAGGKMVLSTYSYVSLFGVTTLEQLKYSIFEN
jgi:tRNA A37 threonylcarbamoyladenosine biosynthesis protein TsaE